MRGRRNWAGLFAALVISGVTAASAQIQEGEHAGHTSDGQFGKVHFPISCSPATQQNFDLALAKLHSFFYPETIKAFTAITEAEPFCAMAFWGLAISQMPNPLVPPFEPAALKRGSEFVEKARAAKQQTPREHDWIEALAALYKDSDVVDEHTRDLRYESAMERLHNRYPADREAAVFYALALNMAVDLSDGTFAKQLKAAALLEDEWTRQPDHPGIPHYLIHSYDYPPIAVKGLGAARRYAQVAPSAPHALHMPSHIFSMTGMWQDSIASNLASKAAAEDYSAKFQQGATAAPRLHAMDFLMYAYLQGAQDKAAGALLVERNDIQKFVARYLTADTAYAALPVRYAIERGDWKMAAALEPIESQYPQAEAISHFGRALGAARSNDFASARREIERLETLKGKLQESKQTFWVEQLRIQIHTVSAWIAKGEDRKREAVAAMREAAQADDVSQKHVAMENRLVPMRELLGEMLLGDGDAAGALKAFETSLTIAPNRLRSHAGAASAAEMLGDAEKARFYHQKIVDACGQADTERPELVAARRYLAKS
jgi:tetratricopeptide (TPR) repeat protein